jgi:hypothetical protein
LFFKCPVNVTVTDQYGQVIDDQGTNEIPDADVETTEEEKFFNLPPNLQYYVDISAYDVGDFTAIEASPVTTDITLINAFHNIPVTDITKAMLEIAPDEMDRSMEIDYDGDGIMDEEKSPDASEIIRDTTITITLQLGWNLISLPLEPFIPYTAESMCDEINAQGGSATIIQGWDGSGWQPHQCGQPFGDFDIESDKGCFVYCTAPSTWRPVQ